MFQRKQLKSNSKSIVKACKSHDFCFKNPLTNGPGWPGHSYDQLTSLLDPPSSSHPRWVALMSPKKRPPAFAWATCSGAPNWKRDRCGGRGGWRVAWWFHWRLGILDDNCVDELTIENPVGFSNSHKFTTFLQGCSFPARDFHQHCTQFIQFESRLSKDRSRAATNLRKRCVPKHGLDIFEHCKLLALKSRPASRPCIKKTVVADFFHISWKRQLILFTERSFEDVD